MNKIEMEKINAVNRQLRAIDWTIACKKELLFCGGWARI